MTFGTDSVKQDFGLIAPVSLPPDGRVPDPATGASSQEEYDRYFRILRDQGDLLAWSRSCLELIQQLLSDLDGNDSGLDAADQRDILRGFLVVTQITLNRWVDVAKPPSADGEKQ